MEHEKRVPINNSLIAALPQKDRRHFLAGCEKVKLVLSEVIGEPGEALRHIYFPTDSFISLVRPIQGHTGLEVALVGNEGMHGISVVLGIDSSYSHVLVQGEGLAMRMDVASFRRELRLSQALQQLLNRYIYVRLCQLEQTAACTRFHVVEERLARWLLMTHDRAFSDELHITHEFLAFILGVRRVGITRAAGSLQKRNLISYRRGIITVLDRRGLEAASCNCYRADRTTYDDILGEKLQNMTICEDDMHTTSNQDIFKPRSSGPERAH
ncbi:Crp/Fnr family transcriptional regulator [Thiohalophilus thiocyanatoxydans]|uniref:CRP-like cAMP-binding protein n=1 Tax=Thiohalophilus thiocyanatoxydans TaxID=381308 RepID=A0A4V3H3U5_9GAMM|nr:Crp/Fnr family transcriptional regulator [Thiohalophilus thiocyanatoxydans]TDY00615.1 CRP-like cAMP-binding protein [Thiohalophilus thiocyanatoxydans]